MPLVLQNNRLLLSGSALAGSQSCCCENRAPPLRPQNCNSCCPDSVQELAVKIDFSISEIFQRSSNVVMPLGGAASYSGVVLLNRVGQNFSPPACGYTGIFCNVNSFIALQASVFFTVFNGLCRAGGSVLITVGSCLNNAVDNDTSGCCPPNNLLGFAGLFGISQGNRPLLNLGTQFWNYSNQISYRPPMTKPCQFAIRESGDATLLRVGFSATGPDRSGCVCDALVDAEDIANWPPGSVHNVSYSLAMESV